MAAMQPAPDVDAANRGYGGVQDASQIPVSALVDVFGPEAYNVQPDRKRYTKERRQHIPPNLLGPSEFITERVDGLITDATKSPFTTLILPYQYLEDPDRRIEWNVWRFDEGLASRVPYESSARTLSQSKETFSGYTVRQGLAITLEHNFMMSKMGMQNFESQIKQVVQSIQTTNDLDVHQALLTAPSYQNKVREGYYVDQYIHKALQDYKDNFGFVQKNMNAMDIIIEDTKARMLEWGGSEPDFMLCSSKLCFQLTMMQERTEYYTQGPDGKKLLKQGPDMPSYRGLKVIKSKSFSLDEGSQPRDLLRRRVRTAEFYLVPKFNDVTRVLLYDEASDNWAPISKEDICRHALRQQGFAQPKIREEDGDVLKVDASDGGAKTALLLRPNIEHYMLALIIGRGGLEHLGATFWGQTEMSVFDDGQHGVWGMTYKYHERAIVINERNMHRVWDVAYDGYNGGKGMSMLNWNAEDERLAFVEAQQNLTSDYMGKDIIAVLMAPDINHLPSPMPFGNLANVPDAGQAVTDELVTRNTDIKSVIDRFKSHTGGDAYTALEAVCSTLNDQLQIVPASFSAVPASVATTQNNATSIRLFYQGTIEVQGQNGVESFRSVGCGHHGPDYPGVASVRNGKSLLQTAAPLIRTAAAPQAQPPARA